MPDAIEFDFPTFLSITKAPLAPAVFEFVGPAGTTFILQDSADLQSWSDIETITMTGSAQTVSGYSTELRRYVRFRRE